MRHRYPLKILISLVVVAACAFGCYQRVVTVYSLPLFISISDAHSAVIRPLPYQPLPAGLQPGDKLDLQTMDMESRYAVMPSHYIANSWGLHRDGNYQLSVHRGDTRIAIPVAAIPIPASHLVRHLYRWVSVITFVLLSGLVLLVLWRGQGSVAAGFMLWSLGTLCASALATVEAHAVAGTIFVVMSDIFSVLSGVGLYCLVEFMVGATLSARIRWLWRAVFLAVLAAGALTSQIIGPIVFVTMGWASLVGRSFQVLWAISFLVPIIMLYVHYRSVGSEQRLKMRWMLWSGVLWAFAVLVNYSQTAGIAVALIVGGFLYLLAMLGFLYAVLRHRAVDVSVFIDHALVYGSVTALVVGILATLNSVLQHAALGTGASLLLQVIVPLALGIVLVPVRKYADQLVERVFFRRKYLAVKALRHFAQHAGGYERADSLLAAAQQLVHDKLGSPGVAIYTRNDDGYAVANQVGKHVYPAAVSCDDAALTVARARTKVVDLSELNSALGSDGYVLPMGQQAVLVCANRPGEHYSADERKLLAYVARQVGSAVETLRMQEAMRRLEVKASLVDAVLDGSLPASAKFKARARELVGAAAG